MCLKNLQKMSLSVDLDYWMRKNIEIFNARRKSIETMNLAGNLHLSVASRSGEAASNDKWSRSVGREIWVITKKMLRTCCLTVPKKFVSGPLWCPWKFLVSKKYHNFPLQIFWYQKKLRRGDLLVNLKTCHCFFLIVLSCCRIKYQSKIRGKRTICCSLEK